jgi:uncharacterized membrane protein YfcA
VEHFFLVAIGLLGGILGGLLGIGGGIIFVLVLPAFLLDYGVSSAEIPSFLIANSLFGVAFSSLSGLYRHYRYGNLLLKELALIAAFSIVVSILVMRFVVNSSFYTKEIFDFVFYAVIFFMMLQTFLALKKEKYKDEHTPVSFNYRLAFVGILSGMVSPLTGLGGGILVVPLLNNLFRYTIKKATAVSIGVIFVTALCTTVYNMLDGSAAQYSAWQLGYIIFPLAIPLSIGVVMGGSLGVRLNRWIAPNYIQWLFLAFLTVVLLKRILIGS